jgi:exopolysaccharide production protein ExoQ
MANETSALDFRALRLELAPWAVELAFVGLLLIVFVGVTPFTPPALTLPSGSFTAAGSGDAIRQISYLSVFALILIGALQKRGLSALSSVPLLLALLIAWCLASAHWAGEPSVALRRATLEAVLVVSVMLGVDTVGTERALYLWRWLLVAVLIVNWVSIPFVANAVHHAGEQDAALVGAWRGLYGHKNIAGSVCALTAIVFFFSGLEKRRLTDALVVVLALGFLWMTRSKSSLGLLPVAVLAGSIYRLAWRRELDRLIVCVAALLLSAVVLALFVFGSDQVMRVLEDPSEFTGRAAIWQAELSYIRDHPLRGSGFGTFADTGGISPLRNYVVGSWIAAVAHGHSGYLQILVTVGSVGFVFAILGLVVVPLCRFWPIVPEQTALRGLLFAIFTFLVLHNFMESDFLADDGPAGVALLLALAMLGSSTRELREQRQWP